MRIVFCPESGAYHILAVFSIYLTLIVSADGQDLERQFIPFSEFGIIKPMALTGGLNNPQFSTADFNNDGHEDLFIFDRTGNLILTFINSGNPGITDYQFSPEYIDQFPSFSNFALLRDYNCDGIKDMFGYSQVPGIPGVEVHQGRYDNQNRICFSQVLFPEYFYDLLWFPGFNNFPNNLFVQNIDIPDFVDVDEDGDMDVLTFDFSGGYVEYYENKSADMGYNCDSLIFRLVDNCWGRFAESASNGDILLSPSPDSCVNRSNFIGGLSPGLHVGSSLLALDLNNDGAKEIIIGDASLNSLTLLENGLNPDTAFMIAQDPEFPVNDLPVDLTVFPASFSLDVDNDGIRDLLVAPNEKNGSENYACSWFYKNVGSNEFPDYTFQNNAFLVEDMIDLGSGSSPAFFDHNGDGLLDIVVGTRGYFPRAGGYDARLFLFENTGSPQFPAFNLIDEDYGGLTSYNYRSLHPAFGDLDGDGDKDMLLGEEGGQLLYLENSDSGSGLAIFNSLIENYAGIDVGETSAPQLVDLDGDLILDLVVGEAFGNLNYYHNTGTLSNPAFNLENELLGMVDTRDPGSVWGSSQPVFYKSDGEFFLFTGSEPGSIDHYSQIEGNLESGSFTKLDTDFGGIEEGNRLRIAVADINSDGDLDFLAGNMRGGLALYSTQDFSTATINQINPDRPFFSFGPNPVRNELWIRPAGNSFESYHVQISGLDGKIMGEISGSGTIRFDLSEYSNGIYLIQVRSGQGFQVEMFVKIGG